MKGTSMELLRLRKYDQDDFAVAPEAGMDLQFGQFGNDYYLVIGGRVGVLLEADNFTEPNRFSERDGSYLDQDWLTGGLAEEARVGMFNKWLSRLPDAPALSVATPAAAAPSLWSAFGPISPLGPLPPAPPRPPSIHGHLPFQTTTMPNTLIYRWESYPTSRRIDRAPYPPTIAADTYAAPASEVPFAPTGFAAVARFALPNLMPACFRYELQPVAGTVLECGASVPLYGQSGGGVEVRFPSLTQNRCAIADPVVLAAL
jgi:hypothetical protein